MTTPSDDLRATRPRLLFTTLALSLCVLVVSGASGPEASGAGWRWAMVAVSVVVFSVGAWTLAILFRSES